MRDGIMQAFTTPQELFKPTTANVQRVGQQQVQPAAQSA